MSMKKTLLGTALSLATILTALPAMAQAGQGARDGGVERGHSCEGRHGHHRGRGHHRGHNPERFVAKLKADLGLSDSQATRVRAVLDRSQQEAQGLERTPENREAHREIRERSKQQIDAILTPAQRARAEELRAERRAQREERRGERHRGGEGRGPNGGRPAGR